MHERSVPPYFCVHALSSSVDAGLLYVDLKLPINYFASSSQLPIVSFSSLPNHDHAAPMRCSCRLCIVVSFEPRVFSLLANNRTTMIVAPVIRRTSASHVVIGILWVLVLYKLFE
jgi:hypothetical protein